MLYLNVQDGQLHLGPEATPAGEQSSIRIVPQPGVHRGLYLGPGNLRALYTRLSWMELELPAHAPGKAALSWIELDLPDREDPSGVDPPPVVPLPGASVPPAGGGGGGGKLPDLAELWLFKEIERRKRPGVSLFQLLKEIEADDDDLLLMTIH